MLIISNRSFKNTNFAALIAFTLTHALSCTEVDDNRVASSNSETIGYKEISQTISINRKPDNIEHQPFISLTEKMGEQVCRVNGFQHIKFNVDSLNGDHVLIVKGDLHDKNDLIWIISYLSTFESPINKGIWSGRFKTDQELRSVPFTLNNQ